MRERGESRKRGTERGLRERREESQERGEKRAQTDTDTDVESIQAEEGPDEVHFSEGFKQRSHCGVC